MRVRRYRERRREGVCCLTVEMYEAEIAETTARGLLKPGDHAWNVLDAWYASHLSDAALRWAVAQAVMRAAPVTLVHVIAPVVVCPLPHIMVAV